MPPTPLIPVPPPRYSPRSLTDTPPPTVRVAAAPPLPPGTPLPPAHDSDGSGSYFPNPAGEHGPIMPEVGEAFHGFKLVDELGRGTFGRVFLAEQASLAGRLVALKVTLRPTREPDRLARLQHTNVVPVFSVHAIGQMQLICMPFRGRKTLADELQHHRSSARSGVGGSRKATKAQRASATVTDSVTRPKSAVAGADSVSIPAAPPPALVCDPWAVLRLLAQLAAGLGHAHERGILHLDIKPGNVLLADTGEPMLLDFNLSVGATEVDRELVGGTIPYMAPEQLLDMRSRGRGTVDARTDLYSLGVLVYELLAGEAPFPGGSRTLAAFDALMAARKKGPPPLRAKNPAVTPATEAVVRKLLAPDPADRYQTAAELKDDVDRQLSDRPLKFAREASVRERAGKWRRRNPRVLVGGLVALVLVAAAGTGAVAVQAADGRSNAEAREKARDARDRMHALRLDLTVPDEPLYAARGVEKARALLAAYGLPDDPNWRDRDDLRRLPDDTRTALVGDLGELLVLLGRARFAQAAAQPDARPEAERCARAAADCFPDAPPPALVRLRRDLGMPAADARPTTARDFFLDAVDGLRAGRHDRAAPALETATLLDPGHAAAHFLLGWSRGETDKPDRAAERYAVAAGLMPAEHRAYRRWAWAESAAGNDARAAFVMDRAAARPGAVSSDADFRYLLGVTRARAGRHAEAVADLSEAIRAGVRPVSGLLVRAASRAATGDPAGAGEDRAEALRLPASTAVESVERGRFREGTDPAGARADYRGATGDRGQAAREGYRGLTRLALGATGTPAEALAAADAALARYPDEVAFHAARALALARLGRAADVRTAAAAVAKLDPGAEDAFRTGAALARSGEHASALIWLRRAYLGGVRQLDRYDLDADLHALRSSAEYAAFRAAISELGDK